MNLRTLQIMSQKGQNKIKKNNHVIPRCLLKQWVTFEDNRYGVHVYEIPKKKYSYSHPKNQRGYSFAIEDYIYVPIDEDERSNNLEDWLSGLETTFDAFVLKIKGATGKPLFNSLEEYSRLLMALLSFNNRSVYDISLLKKHYTDYPKQKLLVCPDPRIGVELLVLQNLVYSVTELAQEYRNCRITVYVNDKGNFLLCDRPFLNEPIPCVSFLPITPYLCISIDRTKPNFYTYEKIDEKLLNKINETIVQRARKWIISRDKKGLERIAHYCRAFDITDGFETHKVKYPQNVR